MMYAIIGAGMAGLACAEELTSRGFNVTLLDKSRGPGGRMSSRRVETILGTASFDHGAQYFTARDPSFSARVARWADDGVVAKWVAAGAESWVGVPAMNAPLRSMAARQSIIWSARTAAMTYRHNKWHLSGENVPTTAFDGVVVALPAEQTAPLLTPWEADFASIVGAAKSAPCWTVMLAFSEPLPTKTIVIADDEVIGWAANNSNKPYRSGPDTWVIQADQDWSTAHLEQPPEEVIAAMTERLAYCLMKKLPEPIFATAHRWRYARSANAGRVALYNPILRLGVCGDWLLGSRVECAWLSGTRLAENIIAAHANG